MPARSRDPCELIFKLESAILGIGISPSGKTRIRKDQGLDGNVVDSRTYMGEESTDAMNRRAISSRRKFLKSTALGMGAAISSDGLGVVRAEPVVSGEVDAHPPLIDEIVQPDCAPDVGVKVRLGKPVEVMLAPEGDQRWGFFMFPSIWRLRDGRLVCAVTLGGDHMPSEMDYHYLWYISYDEGRHWTHAVINVSEAEAFLKERFTFASGRQVYYEPKLVSLDVFDTKPYPTNTSGEDGYFRGIKLLYRLGDLPKEHRYVTMHERGADEEQWKAHRATMDPDILLPAFKETVVDGDPINQLTHGYIATRLRKWVRHVGDQRLPNPGVWAHRGAKWATPKDLQGHPKDVVPRIRIPTPSAVRLHDIGYQPIIELGSGDLIVSAFGTRLRLAENKAPGNRKTHCHIFRSSDAGRNWFHDSTFPYRAAGECPIAQVHISPNMPAGNWMAAIRTWSKKTGTAKSPLLLSRSYDEGRNWTTPVAVRPSSVNPAGGLLANGVAYRMYGRPGQFIMFNADGQGKQWGNDVTIVPVSDDPKNKKTGVRENSCANSSDVVLGPNRFMVAYTDYDHRDAAGRVRKAVLVREVVVDAPS